jgi:hypothetical protein
MVVNLSSPPVDGQRSALITMKLNLKQDAQKIRGFIAKRIADYPVYVNLGPGEDEDPISLVTFGYYVFQTGYFAMVFDTRPDADSDGNWTLHIENDTNVLEFPKWCSAYEKLCDGGSVDVILPNDAPRTLGSSDDEESVAKLFGEMILDIIQGLQKEHAFDVLPLTRNAFFIIEEFDGTWGWPKYEKRKSLGRIRKK